MAALICDPEQVEALIRRRREMGGDRYDEVWDGLYIMSPAASPEHQSIIARLVRVLLIMVEDTGRGQVYPGANVTDRIDDWEKNYRCPDVVVVLKGSEQRCRNIGAAFLGGPDFLVEVRSPGDRSLEKLDFYASIGVRELMVVDRDTKAVQLFRLQAGQLVEVPSQDGWRRSEVVGLSFRTAPPSTLEVQASEPPERLWRI